MLVRASYMVAASFLVSTVLNFGLAKYLIHSPSGTPEFAEEMARMTALSYPDESRQIGSGQTGDGKSEHRHFKSQ